MGAPDDPSEVDESWGDPVAAPPPKVPDSDRTEIAVAPPSVAATPVPAMPAVNDRTIAGLGVMTPRPSPFALVQRVEKPEAEEPSELAHPEQSPLAFVMRASQPTVARPESHDMSQFVAGLVAETAPVVEGSTTGTAMEPVMRRSRKRKQWFIAGAIAVVAIVGATAGMVLGGGETPQAAASEAPVAASPVENPAPPAVEPTAAGEVAAAPPVEAPPTAPAVEAPPAAAPVEAPGEAPVEAPPAQEPTVVAIADTAPRSAMKTVAKPTTKPSTTKPTTAKKKTVATKTPTKATKKPAAKTTAKNAPAKKAPAKTTAKATKKNAAKKPAPTKRKPAPKKPTKKRS